MFRRRYYRSGGGKYSNETVQINIIMDQPQQHGVTFPHNDNPDPQIGEIVSGVLVVPATNIMGTRKVKNFTVKLSATGNETPIMCALVYVPQGTVANTLNMDIMSQSFYEPNQNVIGTFVIPPSCGRNNDGEIITLMSIPPTIYTSKLSRNLQSGDTIVILFGTPQGIDSRQSDPMVINGIVNYAIKY